MYCHEDDPSKYLSGNDSGQPPVLLSINLIAIKPVSSAFSEHRYRRHNR